MFRMNFDKRLLRVVIVSFLAGIFWLVAVRFVTFNDTRVHYHANFAVFVDGERLPFDTFTFYEEVQSCGGEGEDNPKARAHMHDQINHVLHVHDEAATWGHFFANLGMTNGDTVFKTDADTYVESGSLQIRFLLNNEEVNATANRTIKSEDTLLISIGSSSDSQLENQYSQIVQNSAEYNSRNDPSSCTGSRELSNWEKLKKSVGISED